MESRPLCAAARVFLAAAPWLVGCPAQTLAPGALGFDCDDDRSCASGYVCLEHRCQPAGTVLDATVLDATGLDATRFDAGGPDRGGLDGAPDDASAADRVTPDTGLADARSDSAATDQASAPDAASGDLLAVDVAAPDGEASDQGRADTVAAGDAPGDRDAAGDDVRAPDAAAPDAFVDDGAADAGPVDRAGADTAAIEDAGGDDVVVEDAATEDAATEDAGGADAGCPADWWDCRWAARVRLSFDNSQQDQALTELPVLVRLTPRRVDLARVRSGGADLRFVDEDGTTELPHEVDTWEDGVQGLVWVRVPRIDARSTVDHIWLYHDNPAAGDAQRPGEVWSDGYRAVWHLDDTSSAVPGVAVGTEQGGFESGFIGAGKRLRATSQDFVRVQQEPSVLGALTQFTATAWIRSRTLLGNWRGILSARHDDEIDYGVGNWVLHTTGEEFGLETQGEVPNTFRASMLTPQQWHMIAAVLDRPAGRVLLYLDGREVARREGLNLLEYTDQNIVEIGKRYFAGADQAWFDGTIDEVQVAATARSAAWLRAAYLAQSDAFVRYGDDDAWWDARWHHRVRLDLVSDTLDENLANFPLRVTLTPGAVSYSVIASDGADLRFVDPDGRVLAHEVEHWVHGGTSELWVRVPQVNAYNQTDHLWLYYDAPGASSVETRAGTWDGDFVGVYHLDGHAANSATGFADGVVSGASLATARVARGYDFDASATHVIAIADSAALDQLGSSFTVSAWVYRQAAQSDWVLIAGRERGTGNDNLVYLGFNLNRYIWYLSMQTASPSVHPAGAPPVGTWLHLAGTYNGARSRLLVDGVVLGAADAMSSLPADNNVFSIGADSNDDGQSWDDHFDGIVDEVRVSTTARSPSWIRAEVWSVDGALILMGTEESQ